MATQDPFPGTTATTTAAQPSAAGQAHYTGVVVIHGIGDTKRNTTLQEAVNALAYWFNHKAGLSLRREGPGRIWVTAHLTDDPNPDAAAARASMQLSAPGAAASADGEDAALHLEFREVWWAESCGLPSVGATIRWTRAQFGEQAANLMLLFGRDRRRVRTAEYVPTDDSYAAIVPPSSSSIDDTSPMATKRESAAASRHIALRWPERTLLTAALWFYSLLQYVWKALQWLVLAPLAFLLLLVMGLVRLLALFPPLQSTVVASLSAVLEYIMLHWIAEAQVYTQDYIRSAGIRERFEREVRYFLGDDYCDRIVVIAHSMGTVIAYEGLTTVLSPPHARMPHKPMAFICLAQALRRIWLMTPDDPHRLRGVLPDHVRWLHFWARYDPVAAGPLSARSLPRVEPWPDLAVPDPQEEIRARLEQCQNVAVVNTDSTFTDHTTYWENLEQVVGPIARELVAGHPALEHVVQAHLATPDEVLLRRWRVAWRATVAIISGIGLGLGLLIWDERNNWTLIGEFLRTNLGGILESAVQAIVGPFFGTLQLLWNSITALAALSGKVLSSPFQSLSVTPQAVDVILSSVAALTVTSVSMLAINSAISLRSLLAFQRGSPARESSARYILALSGSFLVLFSLLGFLFNQIAFSEFNPPLAFVLALEASDGIGVLSGGAATALALLAAWRTRQWGWIAAILLLMMPYLLLLFEPVPVPNPLAFHTYVLGLSCMVLGGVTVAAVGCLLHLIRAARSRRFGRAAALVLVLLALMYATAAVPLYALAAMVPIVLPQAFPIVDRAIRSVPPFPDFAVVVGVFVPILVYALASSPTAGASWPQSTGRRSATLATISLVLLNILAFWTAGFRLLGSVESRMGRLLGLLSFVHFPFPSAMASTSPVVFWGAGAVGLLALGWALIHAALGRRWGWFGTMFPVVMLIALTIEEAAAFAGERQSVPIAHLPLPSLALAVCIGADTAALIYGLWGAGQ